MAIVLLVALSVRVDGHDVGYGSLIEKIATFTRNQ